MFVQVTVSYLKIIWMNRVEDIDYDKILISLIDFKYD